MTSPQLPHHATATTADLVRADGKNLVARAATPGTYTTTLEDGRSVSTTIARVAAPLPLTQWTLDVDDWLPGRDADRDRARPAHAPARRPEGLGGDPRAGRRLRPRHLHDHVRVGRLRRLPRARRGLRHLPRDDQRRARCPRRTSWSTTLDAGPYLIKGTNTIKVEVATTLNNRLRVADVAFRNNTRQNYGLIGPARLVPVRRGGGLRADRDARRRRRHGAGDALAERSARRRRFGAFTPGVRSHLRGVHHRDGHEHRGRRGARRPTAGTLTNGAFSLAGAAADRVQPGRPGPARSPTTRSTIGVQAAHRRHPARCAPAPTQDAHVHASSTTTP